MCENIVECFVLKFSEFYILKRKKFISGCLKVLGCFYFWKLGIFFEEEK